MTPREVLAFIRERDVKAVDLRFMDFPGLWKHFTIPAEMLDERAFEDGIGFDGASLRGWQAINESDMIVVPQPETLFIDPFLLFDSEDGAFNALHEEIIRYVKFLRDVSVDSTITQGLVDHWFRVGILI